VRDGFRGEYDAAVVISNDSDLTEPIHLGKLVPITPPATRISSQAASSIRFLLVSGQK